MKMDNYIITFYNGDVVDIRALGEEEAAILAQAEQIKQGRDYTVKSIVREFTTLTGDVGFIDYYEPKN